MEKEKKKIDIKIIIIVIVVIIAIVEGIVIFANNMGTSKGLQAKDCIGTWKLNEGTYYLPTIILYEGGTGKGFYKDENDDGFVSFTWEIKDNILNVTESSTFFGGTSQGYKIENGKMSSVTGKYAFYKVK